MSGDFCTVSTPRANKSHTWVVRHMPREADPRHFEASKVPHPPGRES